MDALDRAIINTLQDGFPICAQPYEVVAQQLGTTEQDLLARLGALLEAGTLSRFGPMYHAERLGGALSLAALKVPPQDYERVAGQVNALPEVAHNYERNHALNMWFVLATETSQAQADAVARIERETGCTVYNMPKQAEYFVELKLRV